MKIKVLSDGTTKGEGVRVIVGEQTFDYSWMMLNPYQLVGLLQFLGHEVEWDNGYKFE